MRECARCQSCFPDTAETCAVEGQPLKHTLPIEIVVQGRYRLQKRIGQGSVGIVYVAQDLDLDTPVAVKIILPDLIGNNAKIGEAFLREATATTAVQHPNIVAVIDSGIVNGAVPFIVMEFISGRSLEEILSGGVVLTPPDAFAYVSTIGSGLAAAHQLGIAHGDLKPRNILIIENRPLADALKILDFGMSSIKSGKLSSSLVAPKLSSMLRSPLYLAPEAWSDGEPDHRSDIYGLGVILYQMLAGEVPFKGRSIPAIMKQHLLSPPPPLNGPSRSVSPAVEAVVLHALEKEPENRPATVAAFIDELRSSLEEIAAPTRHSEAQRKKAARTSPKATARKSRNAQTPADDDSGSSDLEQTIVLRSSRARVKEQSPETLVPKARAQPDLETTVVLPSQQKEFDLTLVPGMTGYPSVVTPAEEMPAAVSPPELRDADLKEFPKTEELDDFADWTPDAEEEQRPKSVSPVLLATGVILVILLVAIGIFYSRMSQ